MNMKEVKRHLLHLGIMTGLMLLSASVHAEPLAASNEWSAASSVQQHSSIQHTLSQASGEAWPALGSSSVLSSPILPLLSPVALSRVPGLPTSGPAFLAAAAPAQEPSSGLGLVISGWILTGVGALNLVTLPACFLDFYDNAKNGCLVLSGTLAAVGLGVGIPLLVVGYNHRKKHKAWEASQTALHLRRTTLSALPGGAQALYTARF